MTTHRLWEFNFEQEGLIEISENIICPSHTVYIVIIYFAKLGGLQPQAKMHFVS